MVGSRPSDGSAAIVMAMGKMQRNLLRCVSPSCSLANLNSPGLVNDEVAPLQHARPTMLVH